MSDQKQKRLLHVSFALPAGVERKQIEGVFNKASDWLKYAPNCWILRTAHGVEVWQNRLSAVPGMENANIFVCEFERDGAAGLLPEWMWEWLDQKTS